MDSSKRSLAKAISWRITGTIDTMIVSFIITGNPLTALKIGAVEVLTKIFLYYLHERLWGIIVWGKDRYTAHELPHRSATKAITWRITGTIDTIFISFLITGHFPSALGIGFFEVVTKSVLYYIHERIWLRIGWGKSIGINKWATEKVKS
ncbi:MAG: DUF2061 domain-containing protein [Microscillaceae bacterium]|nr:DUF2061 domain-containing protein [Microscillaceae bacterium]